MTSMNTQTEHQCKTSCSSQMHLLAIDFDTPTSAARTSRQSHIPSSKNPPSIRHTTASSACKTTAETRKTAHHCTTQSLTSMSSGRTTRPLFSRFTQPRFTMMKRGAESLPSWQPHNTTSAHRRICLLYSRISHSHPSLMAKAHDSLTTHHRRICWTPPLSHFTQPQDLPTHPHSATFTAAHAVPPR